MPCGGKAQIMSLRRTLLSAAILAAAFAPLSFASAQATQLDQINALLTSGQTDAAWQLFDSLRIAGVDTASMSETAMIGRGYQNLRVRNLESARELMRMTTVLYPSAWNAWDSLGEVLLIMEEINNSKSAFERSVELNPDNQNGKAYLARIEGMVYSHNHQTQDTLRYEPGVQTGLKGKYLGQTPSGRAPEVFAPGIVSTAELIEFGLTFMPDGKTLYYNHGYDVWTSHLTRKGWTAPEPAWLNGPDLDHEVNVSRDGKRIFWGSRRPLPDDSVSAYGNWYVDRVTKKTWSEPKYLGEGMAISSADDGTIYLTTFAGRNADISSRSPQGDGYADPVLIPGAVNTQWGEAHPCIAPDQSFLVFDRQSPESKGGPADGDLYVSFRNPDGAWGEAIPLGDDINTIGGQFGPTLSPDGKYLFYCSNLDIYWVSIDRVLELKPKG